MYIKIILNALTQLSINRHVYNSKNTVDHMQKALTQFILKHFLFWIVGQTIQVMLF
jgi:hypothetical protein